MRIVLVHGFHVRDGGRRTVDQLAEKLRSRGHTVDTDSADYGFYSLFMVRFFGGKAVKRIRRALEDADAAITHSNGAHFTTRALRKITNKKIVVHLSPALNRKTKPPQSVFEQHVFFTRHDKPLKWASWLIAHPWGSMGAYGYTGNDGRVYNHDFTDQVKGHSDWFRPCNRGYFAKIISDLLQDLK